MAATYCAYPAASAAAAANLTRRRPQTLNSPGALPAVRKPSRQPPSFLSFRRPNAALPPLRVAGADPQIVNGEDFPPMNDLIRLYKKAFLDGNEDVVCDIEKAITSMEEERSKAASQFDSITAEITSGKNKFLRLNADLENFRKQTEKDRAKFTSNIQVELVQSLLPLVDSFEKTNVEVTLETEKEQKISTSYQGIYKQLVETLKSLGVGVVETVGKPFDPVVHEAIAREESTEFKAGIVSHEVHRGFLLRERVLRPAAVKVSTGPGDQNTSSTTSEEPVEDTKEDAAV
ncbi:Protein grpE [Hordeum vulgare]|uniref:GrpE protein homolog n=1 Tax=Hordeum vulgare subsp. vulgare TaxID=112509 RepID=A0A8I6WP99_HORVV|nr:protein GrpE-like [Hordeum vulgare subsp. vulgare]KAE8820015.1 Protein grpE [Hordeum vulgare]